MFERCLYFNINALTRAVNRIWGQAFDEFGLSPSHAYMLRLVLSNPGLSPKQISSELKLDKSTITRFLDAMEKKGFVQRKKVLVLMLESRAYTQPGNRKKLQFNWSKKAMPYIKK